VGPDDSPADHGVDEIPGDAAPAAEADAPVEQVFDQLALHEYMTQAASDGKISIPSAKQVLHHFGVARAKDLTIEQVAQGKEMVDKMIAAAANK
jgi:hypothetical protein